MSSFPERRLCTSSSSTSSMQSPMHSEPLGQEKMIRATGKTREINPRCTHLSSPLASLHGLGESGQSVQEKLSEFAAGISVMRESEKV